MAMTVLYNQHKNLNSYKNKHLFHLHTCSQETPAQVSAPCVPPPSLTIRADPTCSSHGNEISARKQVPPHRLCPSLSPQCVCPCPTDQERKQRVCGAGQGRTGRKWYLIYQETVSEHDGNCCYPLSHTYIIHPADYSHKPPCSFPPPASSVIVDSISHFK